MQDLAMQQEPCQEITAEITSFNEAMKNKLEKIKKIEATIQWHESGGLGPQPGIDLRQPESKANTKWQYQGIAMNRADEVNPKLLIANLRKSLKNVRSEKSEVKNINN